MHNCVVIINSSNYARIVRIQKKKESRYIPITLEAIARRSVYIPANKNPILNLDGNLNFLKTYPKKDRNTLLYWF